jgi:hypothetical protein
VTLFETAARSAQGDATILLLALGLIGLLFSALSLIGDWLDRRAWRRDIARAHQPRPYDYAKDGR